MNFSPIFNYQDRLYVSDLENYRGTYILSADESIIGMVNGIMWFAAPHNDHIYYSNQKDHDFLYCLDTQSQSESCILKRPCSYITAYADKLYFVDETDSRLYLFCLQTGKATPLLKEAVYSFILQEGKIYGSTAKGLIECDLDNPKGSLLTDHIPLCLNYTSSGFIFAARNSDFYLSALKPGQNEPEKIGCIKTQSIAIGENYIYAADLLDNRSIVRVDMISGETIRFCGEKADKLSIIDGHLYFLNQNDNNAWHKMPLSGGRSRRL